MGIAVSEIGGAVEGIDDPSMVARLVDTAAFLGQDGVVRKGAADDADNRRLGLAVGLGHQVEETAFALEADVVQAGPMNRSTGARRPQGDLFDWIHESASYGKARL
jgi:hypothetical protein